jgi:ubiquinone/menaquinone biosynthesis methyltransferase
VPSIHTHVYQGAVILQYFTSMIRRTVSSTLGASRRCFDSRCFSSSTTSSTTTHFGFEQVPIHEKQELVRDVFEKVADNYDLMNDVMSGGIHRYWKDYLLDVSHVQSIATVLSRSAEASDDCYKILDVAGGTGDVAFRFLQAANLDKDPTMNLQIIVCDINKEMLRVGQSRALDKFGSAVQDSQKLQFIQGNAQELNQFDDDSFDLYTIAFGLRNVTDMDAALREANRVLKPGGRYFCLEFTPNIPNPLLRQIYDIYSFHLLPTLGEIVASDRASYQYLVESIRQMPNQDELSFRMQQAGMAETSYQNLSGGIVALHQGFKPL